MGVKAISILSESTKKIISFSNNCRNFRGGCVDSEECTINDNFCFFRLKDTKLDLQTQLFDTIMPNLLPLVFTLFCFYYVEKKDARRLLLIIFLL